MHHGSTTSKMALLCSFASCCAGLPQAPRVSAGRTRACATLVRRESAAARALSDLKRCPAWFSTKPDDAEGRARILTCLERLSKCETPVLREAVRRYVAQEREFGPDAWSKVYVLNRYIFNVPE